MTINEKLVLFVGGPDVDCRLDMMDALRQDFQIAAVGNLASLKKIFINRGYKFFDYSMTRKMSPFSDLLTVFQLFFLFSRIRPQVVHTFDTKPNVLARIAARFSGVPVIVGTVTGLGSLYMKDDSKFSILRIIYEKAQRLACRFSECTIFYNSDDADYFINQGLVLAQKVVIIPGSGISLDRFSQENVSIEDRERIRTELGIFQGQIVITMIARLVRSKGVFDFINVADQLSNQYNHVRFLLVGPQDNESIDALRLADIQSIPEFVTWIGGRKDIENILAITDIIVLPSGREGIPRVLMEAAAMKLPLIAYDSPGCREVVIDQMNGFLVPEKNVKLLGQAIQTLINNAHLRKEFGDCSFEIARSRFEIGKNATRLADVYNNFLDQKGIA